MSLAAVVTMPNPGEVAAALETYAISMLYSVVLPFVLADLRALASCISVQLSKAFLLALLAGLLMDTMGDHWGRSVKWASEMCCRLDYIRHLAAAVSP